ncbi:glycosyltransferase family 52, partial [uncultured Fusobacterium sp.]|uniref:glycosyltransferase family 52 n=2 Tax=uncultured Fusobacterium sp. TaxID=159267 RepID=UPI0025D11F4C
MKKNLEKFFYIDTIYSLFICLLLENNLDKNFYFFSSKFSKVIMKNLKNKLIIKEIRSIKIVYYIANTILFRVIKLFFYNKTKDKKFYIHDATDFTQYFFNNFDSIFISIEDGTLNYNSQVLNEKLEKANRKVSFSKKIKRNFVFGIKKIYPPLGVSEKVEKIILTGILPIPEVIKSKVEIINIEKIWTNLSKEKQKEILAIFNMKIEELEILKNNSNKILLLTQPLSEDGIVSEEEKIKMYENILIEKNIKEIYIKLHPRERTDYVKNFKNIKVNIIKKDFPAEILFLLNINFNKVITLFSTAALNFKGKSEIEFIGTKDYPKLIERFGIIEQRTENREQRTENREQRTEN